MPDLILGCDVDGTLTTPPAGDAGAFALGRLGSSAIGAALWREARKTNLARHLVRESRPNLAAMEVLRQAVSRGWGLVLITALEAEYADYREKWLDANGCPPRVVHYRPDDMTVVEHKARWVRGCALYIDDDADLLKQLAHRLGDACPPLLHVTDWELVPGILRVVERSAGHAV